jgi:hypothetical protein
MANANAPRGLIPYRRASGEPYNSAGNIYYVPASYATNIFVGDPVQIVTASADTQGIPSVRVITAGNGTDTGISTFGLIGAVMGVIPGGEPQIPVTRDLPVFHQASTAGYVLVCDDPDVLYMVQENGSMAGAGPYTAGTVAGPGKNVDLVSGVGSTVTGFSGWTLGSSSLSTNALQMKVLRMLEQADNQLGTNAKWLCRVNLNQLTSSSGT